MKNLNLDKNYNRPALLINGHLETIYPAIFRKIHNIPTLKRIQLNTPDGDFLDTDWVIQGNKKLLILQHGLEGSSDRAYMSGMAKLFSNNGYDICLWNFRGCSGKINTKPIFYHSGATYDLDVVVKEGLKSYQDISLIGFSLGGNLTLKYLGETERDPRIKRAVAISVPLDLRSSADKLAKPHCWIYEKRFLKNLIEKVKLKEQELPGSMPMDYLKRVRSLRDFDEFFTGPIHGFKGAEDYYQKNSARFFLEGIKIPTLILNAKNDPLLTSETLNSKLIGDSKNIKYEITRFGGHVGYALFKSDEIYWSEKRALYFCQTH